MSDAVILGTSALLAMPGLVPAEPVPVTGEAGFSQMLAAALPAGVAASVPTAVAAGVPDAGAAPVAVPDAVPEIAPVATPVVAGKTVAVRTAPPTGLPPVVIETPERTAATARLRAALRAASLPMQQEPDRVPLVPVPVLPVVAPALPLAAESVAVRPAVVPVAAAQVPVFPIVPLGGVAPPPPAVVAVDPMAVPPVFPTVPLGYVAPPPGPPVVPLDAMSVPPVFPTVPLGYVAPPPGPPVVPLDAMSVPAVYPTVPLGWVAPQPRPLVVPLEAPALPLRPPVVPALLPPAGFVVAKAAMPAAVPPVVVEKQRILVDVPVAVPVAVALPVAAAPLAAVSVPQVAAAPMPAAPAMMVTSQRLGDVSIGIEGEPQALRVRLAGSAGAAGLMAADAPRLQAELAASGIRLQSIDFGGRTETIQPGNAAMGGQPSGFGGGQAFYQQGESRQRAAFAAAFVADHAPAHGANPDSSSDRYA